jgi:hypothetical protein
MAWEGRMARKEWKKMCTGFWRGTLKEGHHKEGLGLNDLYSTPPQYLRGMYRKNFTFILNNLDGRLGTCS